MTACAQLSMTIEATPADADVKAIENHLTAFNHRFAPPHDRRPIAVFLRAAGGALQGGLTGYTDWNWLYIDCLWLAEGVRRGGWGTRLIAAAEREAAARGCRYALLFTYSFQAPDFYPRLGYEVFATLDDYPPGHRQYWLRKVLGGERSVK